MPAVQPDFMGSLRTLQQIVEYCAGSKASDAPVEVKVERPVVSRALAKKLRRRVLRIVEAPNAGAGPVALANGRRVWVTTDESGLSGRLVEELTHRGVCAEMIDPSKGMPDAGDVGGLILVASNDMTPGRGFELLQHVGAALISAAGAGGAVLASISRMDGAFGLLDDPAEPTQGGLAGLIKTVAHEWPGVVCKAIDVPASSADLTAVARQIVDELSAPKPIEVGLTGVSRRAIELVDADVKSEAPQITANDVFLITGGARGVTAAAAIALAKRHPVKFLILGRSRQPSMEPGWLKGLTDEAQIKQAILKHEFKERPTAAQLQAAFSRHHANREVQSNLAALLAAGSQVLYRSVDVCDADAVRTAITEATAVLGPVTGVVHAAGILEDRLIVDKTREQFDRVYDTKVVGLRNLLHALDTSMLKHLVMFSSVSARFGNRGQADYSAANEVLNKTARQLARRLPNCRVKSLNWGPWEGGMVNPGLAREFTRRGVELISLEAGAEAFVDELMDSSGDVEVVLGAEIKAPEGSMPASLPASQTTSPRLELSFERTISVASHPFLKSHELGGRPVLPLAIIMEWMAHAAVHAHPGMIVTGISDVRSLHAVALDEAQIRVGFFAGQGTQDGQSMIVPAQVRLMQTDREVPCATATITLAPTRSRPPAIAYSDEVGLRPYRVGAAEAYQELLFHGPHFHCIESLEGVSGAGIIARVKPAPAPERWMEEPLRSDWLTDPLAIDAALQLGILWCEEEAGEPSLPSRIGRYAQYCQAFPRDGATAVLEIREHGAHRVTADVTFFSMDAAVLARLEDCEWIVEPTLRQAFGKRARLTARS